MIDNYFLDSNISIEITFKKKGTRDRKEEREIISSFTFIDIFSKNFFS